MNMQAESIRDYITKKQGVSHNTLLYCDDKFGPESWQSAYAKGYLQALTDLLRSIR